MKKKILIFSLAYYPKHIGGAEVAIKEITDRLSPVEYEFHLICNRFDSTLSKEEKIGNVMVHRIGLTKRNISIADTFTPYFYLSKILYVPLAAQKALQLHQKERFQAWWCMMLYMSYPVVLLRMVGLKLPYVLTLQEGDTFEHVFNRWYIKPFTPLLLLGIRKATVIQTISTFLGKWAKRKGFTGEPILVPNAVNTAHFTQEYSDEELSCVRREFSVADNDVLLVTTSRLVHKNAVDDVVRAIALLPAHVKFIVFGTGPDEAMLKSLITELGVESRVQLRGHIDHAQMPKYLKACNIFIRPSRSEGMGNSFVEAMAAGLPVIATQEGGIADFLFDAKRNRDKGTTGWAVDSDSPEQTKEAVLDILGDEAHTHEVIVRAKAMVIEKYDWNLVATRMDIEVFQPLLNEQTSA